VRLGSFATQDQYFAFVVTGLLITLILQSALTTPRMLRQELLAGTFERMLVSPFGAVRGILAMIVFPLLFACVIAIIGFLTVALIFAIPVQWSTAPTAIPVAVIGALAFASIGLFLTAGTVVFKQSFGPEVVLALISLTGGVYFPIALLPGWLSWISEAQPFTPAADLLRHLLIGTDTVHSAIGSLLKLLAFTVTLLPLSVLTLRWAVRHSRHRGTILEY
jgi:lipooligosaccharide transport system permease protein